MTGFVAAACYGWIAVGLAATPLLLAHADGSTWFDAVFFGAALLAAGVAGFAAARGERHSASARPVGFTDFSALAGELGEGVWAYDIASGSITYSSACATMLGYDADAVPSEMSRWGMLVHEDDLVVARAALDDYLSGRAKAYRVTVRMRRANGEWMEVVDTGRIVARAADGRPRYAIGMHRAATPSPLGDDVAEAIGTDLDHALAGLLGQATLARMDDAASPLERATWRCIGLTQRLELAMKSEHDPRVPTDVLRVGRTVAENAERWTSRRVALCVTGPSNLGDVVVSPSVLTSLLSLAVDEAVDRTPAGGGAVDIEFTRTPGLVVRLRATPNKSGTLSPHRLQALRSLASQHGVEVSHDGSTIRLAWRDVQSEPLDRTEFSTIERGHPEISRTPSPTT